MGSLEAATHLVQILGKCDTELPPLWVFFLKTCKTSRIGLWRHNSENCLTLFVEMESPFMLMFSVCLAEELTHIDNSEARIQYIMRQMSECRSHYMALKAEVATIDRRRKKVAKRKGVSLCIFLY